MKKLFQTIYVVMRLIRSQWVLFQENWTRYLEKIYQLIIFHWEYVATAEHRSSTCPLFSDTRLSLEEINTWPNQILTAFGLRNNRRKDRLIYTDLIYYMTIRHSPLWYFYVIRPLMVLRKNFRLFCKFMKCKGRVGLFRNNVTVNTDFALLHFYCPLYKQFLSYQVFLLIFHALFDFLKWRGKIYWWEKHWTPKRRCKFWRLTNKCSIGTLHYNFYPNPPAFFMAELF